MPLNHQQQAAVELLRQERQWGYRRIAAALKLPPKMVRTCVEQLVAKRYPVPEPLNVVVWDLETTNLKSDIGALLVGGFLNLATGAPVLHVLPLDERPIHEREAELVAKVRAEFCAADVLIGHNSLVFDQPFLQGVCARHGLEALPKRIHLDTKVIAQYALKGALQSISLENLADFFQVGVKLRPSKHEWREANIGDPVALMAIQLRCESDLLLTAAVWSKLKLYYMNWRGR